METTKINLVPFETHRSRKDRPTKVGILVPASTTERTFKAGQMLFRNTAGDFSNAFNATTFNRFIGVNVNDTVIPANTPLNMDVETTGWYIGKIFYELQTPETQTHLTSYANTNGFANRYSMQYEKTIHLEISL